MSVGARTGLFVGSVAAIFVVTFVATTIIYRIPTPITSVPRVTIQAKPPVGTGPFAPHTNRLYPDRVGRNFAPFESGNVGEIKRSGDKQIVMQIRRDNDNPRLPKYWSQWWYASLDRLPVGKPITISLNGRVHSGYYLPVFSYDNRNWQQIRESDLIQRAGPSLTFRRSFLKPKVWLARYVPYTYSQQLAALERWRARRHVRIESLGKSPEGRDIPVVRIADESVPQQAKKTVFVHARAHPGEVAASHLVEGLVDYLTSRSVSPQLLRKLEIVVVPMLNVDGVVIGNNRTNAASANLESTWTPSPRDPRQLKEGRPREVELLHALFADALKRNANVSVALNIHSSNGDPGDRTFFYPHFGAQRGYAPAERALWNSQAKFLGLLARQHGVSRLTPMPREGGREFLAKNIVEAWWWRNRQEKVMAMTIETTYGKTSRHGHWIRPEDLRELGASVGKAIAVYHGIPVNHRAPLLSSR